MAFLAGYPSRTSASSSSMVSYHDVDSSEAAFKVAGSMAIKEALRKSSPGYPRAGHGR